MIAVIILQPFRSLANVFLLAPTIQTIFSSKKLAWDRFLAGFFCKAKKVVQNYV